MPHFRPLSNGSGHPLIVPRNCGAFPPATITPTAKQSLHSWLIWMRVEAGAFTSGQALSMARRTAFPLALRAFALSSAILMLMATVGFSALAVGVAALKGFAFA